MPNHPNGWTGCSLQLQVNQDKMILSFLLPCIVFIFKGNVLEKIFWKQRGKIVLVLKTQFKPPLYCVFHTFTNCSYSIFMFPCFCYYVMPYTLSGFILVSLLSCFVAVCFCCSTLFFYF